MRSLGFNAGLAAALTFLVCDILSNLEDEVGSQIRLKVLLYNV